MKKLTITLLLVTYGFLALSQANVDSVAYEQQRKKINQLLDLRTQKFGQYDVSLTQHTGIFGLQTKKDIRRSNDILMNIVETDNHIFKELKILLDYRKFQQSQVQAQANEVEKQRITYQNSLNRLREQHAKLKTELQQLEKQKDNSTRNLSIVIILLTLGCLLLLIILYRRNIIKTSK